MSQKPAMDAIYSAKRKYEVSFDSDMSVHRRNLFFIAILSFASLMVSPKNGEYSINLGVIAGAVENPVYIYSGLLLICFYQLYYFWILCRSGVLNLRNIAKVVDVYMYELASLVAFNKWNEITRTYSQRGINTAVESFKESPKNPRESGGYKVRAETQEGHLDKIEGLLDEIKKDDNFELDKNRGFYQIDFKYFPTPDDYQYLMVHRDQYWLAKRKHIIEFLLPLVVGLASIMALVYKISCLLYQS